jgi:hypothetical protein
MPYSTLIRYGQHALDFKKGDTIQLMNTIDRFHGFRGIILSNHYNSTRLHNNYHFFHSYPKATRRFYAVSFEISVMTTRLVLIEKTISDFYNKEIR